MEQSPEFMPPTADERRQDDEWQETGAPQPGEDTDAHRTFRDERIEPEPDAIPLPPAPKPRPKPKPDNIGSWDEVLNYPIRPPKPSSQAPQKSLPTAPPASAPGASIGSWDEVLNWQPPARPASTFGTVEKTSDLSPTRFAVLACMSCIGAGAGIQRVAECTGLSKTAVTRAAHYFEEREMIESLEMPRSGRGGKYRLLPQGQALVPGEPLAGCGNWQEMLGKKPPQPPVEKESGLAVEVTQSREAVLLCMDCIGPGVNAPLIAQCTGLDRMKVARILSYFAKRGLSEAYGGLPIFDIKSAPYRLTAEGQACLPEDRRLPCQNAPPAPEIAQSVESKVSIRRPPRMDVNKLAEYKLAEAGAAVLACIGCANSAGTARGVQGCTGLTERRAQAMLGKLREAGLITYAGLGRLGSAGRPSIGRPAFIYQLTATALTLVPPGRPSECGRWDLPSRSNKNPFKPDEQERIDEITLDELAGLLFERVDAIYGEDRRKGIKKSLWEFLVADIMTFDPKKGDLLWGPAAANLHDRERLALLSYSGLDRLMKGREAPIGVVLRSCGLTDHRQLAGYVRRVLDKALQRSGETRT